MPGRPYKVWNSDRSLRKGVVADSLQTLHEKGCKQLDLDESTNITVVLEEDGTEIVDEEYFQCLGDQTIFMFLKAGERWHHPNFSAEGLGDENREMDYVDSSSDHLTELVNRIRSDVTSIITFTSADMQLVVTEDTKQLGCRLNKSERETRDIQNVCQRYLDDRQEAQEAIGLLNMVQQVQRQQSSNQGGGEGCNDNKRQRLE